MSSPCWLLLRLLLDFLVPFEEGLEPRLREERVEQVEALVPPALELVGVAYGAIQHFLSGCPFLWLVPVLLDRQPEVGLALEQLLVLLLEVVAHHPPGSRTGRACSRRRGFGWRAPAAARRSPGACAFRGAEPVWR